MEGRRGAPGLGGAALGANENAQRRRGFEGRPRTRGPDCRNLCSENARIELLFSVQLVDTTRCVSQRLERLSVSLESPLCRVKSLA